MLELVISAEKRESCTACFGARANSEFRQKETEWNRNNAICYNPESHSWKYNPNRYRFGGLEFRTHADIYTASSGGEIYLTDLFNYYALDYVNPITWHGVDYEGQSYSLNLIREASIFGKMSAIVRISWQNEEISDSIFAIDIPSSLAILGIVMPTALKSTLGMRRMSEAYCAHDSEKIRQFGIEYFTTNDESTILTSSQLIVLCDALETISFKGLPKRYQDKNYAKTALGLWLLENDARIL